MSFDGTSYQARFDKLEAHGMDVHGEARLVLSLNPKSVLDAGCGTGRVAIELARHGVEVVGVDVDTSMISEARRRAPDLEWVLADLATLSIGRLFDVVVLAGNVPLFCPPDDRSALVSSCANHLAPGGHLLAGFQLDRGYGRSDFDRDCQAAGLLLAQRWATWDGQAASPDESYAVSLWAAPT